MSGYSFNFILYITIHMDNICMENQAMFEDVSGIKYLKKDAVRPRRSQGLPKQTKI